MPKIHLFIVSTLRRGNAASDAPASRNAERFRMNSYAGAWELWLKGSVSQQHAVDPSAYERANYVQVLDSYTPASGVLR